MWLFLRAAVFEEQNNICISIEVVKKITINMANEIFFGGFISMGSVLEQNTL